MGAIERLWQRWRARWAKRRQADKEFRAWLEFTQDPL